MSALIEQREQALSQRLDQMRQLDEWHLFQNFALGLLPHDGYKDVRHSVVRNDLGRDGVAATPQGEPCFIAVSFDCSLSKIKKDAKRWCQDDNREPAKVIVFVTWDGATEAKISKWRGPIKGDFGLDLRVIHRETIAKLGTREGVWRETCSRLGIVGHRTGYLRVSPFNAEVVRRGLRARPPEWLRQRVPLNEWATLSEALRPRIVLGKPGSGKTTTLFRQLELARPHSVLIVETDLREPGQLEGLLDDAPDGGVIVFDDVQDNHEMFAALCGGLLTRKSDAPAIAKRYKDVTILAAARSQEWAALQPKLPMTQLQDLGLLGKAELTLTGLNEQQCEALIQICRDEWDLKIEQRLLEQGAQDAAKRDATPLFVISMLAAARAAEDRTLKDEHLAGLPEDVLGLWQRYWDRLTGVQQGVLKLVKLFIVAKVEAHAHLLSAAAEVFGIPVHELTGGLDWLDRAIWITQSSGVPTSLDVQIEAIPIDDATYTTWDTFVHGFAESDQTALQLHNGTGGYYVEIRAPRSKTNDQLRTALLAAVKHFQALRTVAKREQDQFLRALALNNASNCYGDLAKLDTTLKDRRDQLLKAVDAVEESIRIVRDLGLRAALAISLNNASIRYSDLAELETTLKARRDQLLKALEATEESTHIRRDLGLRAELAVSLSNESVRYHYLASLETTLEARRERLLRAVDAVEEAISIRRDLGLRGDLANSLNNASNHYSGLAKLETTRKRWWEQLLRAVDAVEEAISIRRDLGLRGDLANSLNNASNHYSGLAGVQATPEKRRQWLVKAVEAVEESTRTLRPLGVPEYLGTSLATGALRYSELAAAAEGAGEAKSLLEKSLSRVEEAVGLFRGAGHAQFTIQAIRHNITVHLLLAEIGGELDTERVVALCDEGIERAEAMGDEDRLVFFIETKRKLTGA